MNTMTKKDEIVYHPFHAPTKRRKTGIGAAFAASTQAAAQALLAVASSCPVDSTIVTNFQKAYMADPAAGTFPASATGVYDDDTRLALADALGKLTSDANGFTIDPSLPATCAASTQLTTLEIVGLGLVGVMALGGIFYLFKGQDLPRSKHEGYLMGRHGVLNPVPGRVPKQLRYASKASARKHLEMILAMGGAPTMTKAEKEAWIRRNT